MRGTVWLWMAAALTIGCGGESETDGGLEDAAIMDAGGDAQVLPACERNLDCDDSLYCNGDETCVPGDEAADARGCVAGESPCNEGEECDDETDVCMNPDCVDGDGDREISKECGGLDCDDEDPRRYGGNIEICDSAGFDEDCDDETFDDDDGDADGDGYVSERCFNLREDGEGRYEGDDCDDTRADVSPEGTEACNGRDDDCDGAIDEGVQHTYYPDADGDSFGDPDGLVEMGCSAPTGHVLDNTDCNDTLGGVSPSAVEVCDGENDPLTSDENCNGSIDEGCGCPSVGAEEACGSPEGLAETGVCRPGIRTCTSVPGGAEWSSCVDAINPVSETGRCNGDDDDCDGTVDEGVKNTYYADTDTDGYGDPDAILLACTLPANHVTNDDDCNDDAAQVSPAAAEICDGMNNPLTSDENCNGAIDEGCNCPVIGTMEACGSPEALAGTGVCQAGTRTCNSAPGGTEWGSCIGAVNPTSETCNGDDDDCDGTVDEGVKTTFYADADSDGYGDPDVTVLACSPPAGHVANDDDCDDGDDDASPVDLELDHPCDGVNNDCDTRIDEGTGSNAPTNAPRWYRDDDGDAYGRASSEGSVRQCANPSTGSNSYATNNDDCFDAGERAHLIHPAATYQSVGHCFGGNSNCTYNGQPGCLGCISNTGPCVQVCKTGDLSFDYDCSGSAQPHPPATCSASGGSCSGVRGPTTSQPSSACGTSVQHRSCCGAFECSWCSVSNQPLACR